MGRADVPGNHRQPPPFDLSAADYRLIREALLRLRDGVDLPAVVDRCNRLADRFGEHLAWVELANEMRKTGVVLHRVDGA
jgi:hypothetical protein